MKDVQLRLSTGHEPGQASVAYASTAKELYLVTAGADGRVCLRDPLILEPQFTAKVDAPPATILAVDPKGKCVAVGDEQYVKLYKLPSLGSDRTACRFNLTLRALAFSPDGSRLAAAGDDNIIKLVEVKDGTVYRSLSVDDYVLSLSWDPEGTYLAAVLRGGPLVLYDVTTGKMEKRMALCERVDHVSPRRHAPSWHPDGGSVLAVPYGAEGEVVLLERLSWSHAGYLSGGHTGHVNVAAFSPNGLYCCTAGQDKRVVVWNVDSASPVAAAVAGEVLSGVAWSPTGNELALVGEGGGMGVWSRPVPPELPGPAVPPDQLERMAREAERQALLKSDAKAAAAARLGGAGEGDGEPLVVPEGGEVREEVIEEVVGDAGTADPDTADLGTANLGADVDMEGEGGAEGGAGGGSQGSEEAGGGGGAAAAAARRLIGGGGGGGGGRALGRAAAAGYAGGVGGGGRGAPQTVRTIVRTIVAPPAGPPPQPPFQPGSTPPAPPGGTGQGQGRGRFLCYNLLGSVSSRPVDDHAAVEVLFHDVSRFAFRVPLLTDYYGFDKASLGEKGVMYASPPTKGEAGGDGGEGDGDGGGGGGVPAMLMFRPFDPWAPNSEWTAPLPAGEEALCLAAGSSFLAAATSTQLLRLFSLAGSQTGLSRLEGPPVAMAAAGAALAVVWHAGPPNPHTKSQQLCMSLYDTTSLTCAFSGPLPLTPGSVLTWLGFTDDHGLPAVADSAGVVAVRTPDLGGRWVPVFEPPPSRRSVEALWPVGLTSTTLFAVVCKTSDPRPQVSPRPFYTPLDLSPPLLAPDGGCPPELEGQALLLGFANAALRQRLDAAQSSGCVAEASDLGHLLLRGQAEADRALLRAFTRLLRGERHGRALELAAQLSLFKSVEGALTLANHHQARGLAERISAFMAQRQALLEATAAATAGAGAPAAAAAAQEAAAEPYGYQTAAAAVPVPAPPPQRHAVTPIPFGKRGAAASSEANDAGGGGGGPRPLAPADLNAGGATPAGGAAAGGGGGGGAASCGGGGGGGGSAAVHSSGGGGLTPFAELLTSSEPPPSTGGTGGGRRASGLPTPNTLLQAATAKPPDTSGDHKRKQPAAAFNNPFARKAPKLAK